MNAVENDTSPPPHPPRYAVWTTGADGRLEPRAHAQDLSETLGTMGPGALVVAVTTLVDGSDALFERYGSLVPAAKDISGIEPRPLTGPFVVPRDWKGRVGAEGYLVADLRRQGEWTAPLVLAAWPAKDLAELESFVSAVNTRLNGTVVSSPAEARTLLERLIPVDHPADGPGTAALELDYERALRASEVLVGEYEDRFRSGKDFTRETHLRIEHMLHELVVRKGRFGTPSHETERVGIESRLVRLLDAQASRDARGALERVLSTLTALVLVPALVAGVFGANVPIPYAGEAAMRWAMFALMGCGGAVSYLVLSGVGQSAATRGLEFRPPGEYDGEADDRAWRARFGFVAMAGAAGGIAFEALRAIWESDAPGIRTSTTGLSVAGAALVLVAIVGWLARHDATERTRLHGAILAGGAVGAALAAAGLLVSSLLLALLGGLVLGAGSMLAFRPQNRAWLGLRGGLGGSGRASMEEQG